MKAQSVQEGLVDLDDLPESLMIVTIYGQTARMRYFLRSQRVPGQQIDYLYVLFPPMYLIPDHLH
jgi:hypothetical protein